jgi:hypothetical protein
MTREPPTSDVHQPSALVSPDRAEPYRVTVAWGMVIDPESPDAAWEWAQEFIHTSVHGIWVDFLWCGALIDRVELARIDGRHGLIPFPVGGAGERTVDAILETWVAAHAEGVACVIATAHVGLGRFADRTGDLAGAASRVRSLTPELSKGLEFDLVVLIDPEGFGEGIEGAVDRYVAMTRATQQLVILTSA